MLTELALVLLPAGITPGQFSDLAKFSFVNAAARVSRFRNGKVNYSRVAVVTGLNRAEVKRLLNEGCPPPSGTSRLSRAERVICGWISDPRFLDKNHKPRALPIRGSRSSFIALVRAYGGDVPHRAVLEELRGSQVVRERAGIVRLTAPYKKARAKGVDAFTRVMPFLVEGLRAAASSAKSRRDVPVHALTLKARDSVELEIVRERVLSGLRFFFEGMRDSLPHATTGMSRRKYRYAVTVSALVREH